MSNFENEKKTIDATRRFLEFSLGGESYAVEILQVKEVITLPETTPIPKAPTHVLGLMNLRGLVLTVVDLRKKLNVQPAKNQTQTAVIIFDLGDRLVGGVVDSIQKVLNVNAESRKPIPDEGVDKALHLLGILQHESKLTLWIDPVALIDGSTKTLSKAA